jgi:KDO2-lipid IV(A) lauroyltransferase
LFRLLAFLPLGLLHAFGTAVGWLAFLGSPTYRRRFLANARLAGLAWPQVRAAVAASGRLLAELPRLWFGRPVPVRWEGEQAVEQALARGRGVIVLTPHLGCFEIIAQGYAARFGPITVLYRRARKAWLTELVDRARLRPNLAAAPTTLGGVRQMLKALRAGQAVGLLPDQVPPQGLGVWAPFFGRDAYTMTLTARLVQQTGATVVLHWGERLGGGRGYCIHAQAAPPLQSGDPAAAAAEVNRWMEGLIARCPGQYLWGYARYKQPRRDSA